MVYLQSTYKRTQSRLIVGYTGKINNDQTLKQFYLKTAPHTQTRTQMKINPGVLQRTPAAREGGELRSQFFWGTCTLEGRDAPWCGTCQWSCSSAHSHTHGDCVHEGARVEQSGVRDGDQGHRQDPRETRSRSGAFEPAQQKGCRGEMRADPLCHDPPSFFGNPRLQPSHYNHCLAPTSDSS